MLLCPPGPNDRCLLPFLANAAAMKALIITSRFPWPSYTGDRVRAASWLSALTPAGEVVVVSPPGVRPDDAPPFLFVAARWSLRRLILGMMTVLFDRLPVQCLMAAPYDWQPAIARARREMGPFDVTVVLLSRMHPWVRRSLEGPTLLDAVDSLRRNAEERRKAAGPATRWLWRMEERRMARLEQDAARTYGRVLVVSEDETAEFEGAQAVTIGISAKPLGDAPRLYDLGFWGRFPYFANADAATWLLDEIWPAIRALRPEATLIMGGAEAPPSLRKKASRSGVTLLSPVDDMSRFARKIRVALVPLRFGSGQSTKVVEAAEAGCAIVGTPQAFRGLAPLACHARVESTASGLARAAVDLLADDALRAAAAARLREIVVSQYARSVTLERLTAIAGATEAR